MTVKERAVQILMDYLTGRGAELALPLEDHCANMVNDLTTNELLVAD